MGRSSSKLVETPNNPIQELEYKKTKSERLKRKREKEQKQIAKLQKKQAKKHKQKRKHSSTSVGKRNSTGLRQGADDGPVAPEHCGSLNSLGSRSGSSLSEYTRQMERKLQNMLNADLSAFLMNQAALSFEFYGNFESDMTHICDQLLAQESEINQNLEEHSVLLPSPLDAACAKWLTHKPVHGPEKGKSQLLQPPAMYVVFENIDISHPNDANYDSISPLCKVDMDTDFYKTTPCKDDLSEMLHAIKWKGYVRLKLRAEPKSFKTQLSEEIYTDGSSGYSTTTSVYSRSGGTRRKSILTLGSETEYDYAYIAKLNTHHPMAELRMPKAEDRLRIDAKILPESCVSVLASFIEPVDDESDEESDSEAGSEYEEEDDDDDSHSHSDHNPHYTRGKDLETVQALRLIRLQLERRKRLLQQAYLNSKEFMRYFADLMRYKIAPAIQMRPEQLDDRSTYRACSIYTDQYEIIPAIHVPQNAQDWPMCAFQFRIRQRPISTDPRTGQQFQWPSRAMIKQIETFGFHVVPVGFAPKRQRNPFRELEWRIVFPKAERFLDKHLSASQVKVFMMAKALVKTFVEPQEKNKALMFVLDHLHTHLYWECERDYTAWPEEFLGDVLVRFIGSFMERLREKTLRDFFIEERNLFDCIPEYSLVTLYSIMANILENPLLHLMVAFRNLEYTDGTMPKLNFRRLYDNLVQNDMLKLKMLAKNARNTITMAAEEDEPMLMVDEEARGLVGMQQHRTNGKLRRKTHLMKHQIEQKKKEVIQQNRVSVESIDVEFVFTRNLQNSTEKAINHGVENLRRTNLLELLLDHLIAMASKATERRNESLAKLYLNQATMLCRFYHNFGCDLGARQYMSAIQELTDELERLRSNNMSASSPPALPVRVSVEPVIVWTQSPGAGKVYEKNAADEATAALRKSISDCEARMRRVSASSPRVGANRPGGSVHTSRIDETSPRGISNTSRLSPHTRRGSPQSPRASPMSPRLSQNLSLGMTVNPPAVVLTPPTPSDMPRPSVAFDPRKSTIKFMEQVTEVHDGDTNPIQRPRGYSPVGILRFGGGGAHHHTETEPQTDASDRDTLPGLATENPKKQEESENPEKQEEEASVLAEPEEPASFMKTKFGSMVSILKATPVLSESKVIKSLASSTDKMLTNVTTEEKRAEICELLRRKKLQLKGAFNQSSES